VNVPARGYTVTHPPFEPGNTVALRHGAWSERLVAARAVELVDAGVLPDDQELAGLLRWVGDADRWQADAWRRAEARVVRLTEWLEEHGLEDADGNLREPAIGLLMRAERAAAMQRDALGLTPTARARLLRDQTAAAVNGTSALERLAARGAAQVRQRPTTTDSPSAPLTAAEGATEPPEIDNERTDDDGG
jgi:hypothetical protein